MAKKVTVDFSMSLMQETVLCSTIFLLEESQISLQASQQQWGSQRALWHRIQTVAKVKAS